MNTANISGSVRNMPGCTVTKQEPKNTKKERKMELHFAAF